MEPPRLQKTIPSEEPMCKKEQKKMHLIQLQEKEHYLSFEDFLEDIVKQLDSSKHIYDQYLNTSHIKLIIQQFKTIYIDNDSAVEIINIIQDFMSYCRNQSGQNPRLKNNHNISFPCELSAKWPELKQKMQINNTKHLKLLSYIVENPQSQRHEYNHCFHSRKFDFSGNEVNGVAKQVKKMCNEDIRAFAFLTNYLYKCCINLDKQNVPLEKIQQKYEETLERLQKDHKPAKIIIVDDLKLQVHPTQKPSPNLIPKLEIDLTKWKEDQKQFYLQQYIMQRALDAKNAKQKFDQMLKKICQEKGGRNFKSRLKIEKKESAKPMARIKEKILIKIYKDEKMKQLLAQSPSSKDQRQKMFIDLYSYVTQDYADFQKRLNKIFSNRLEPIPYLLSDLLAGKCVFQSLQQLNNCCSKIKQKIIRRKTEGIELIEIKNRLKEETSDLVLKILFGNTIAELQLVRDLNTVDYDFAHQLYELKRSEEFLNPLTALQKFNENISKDYFLELKAIILANTRKKSHYNQVISYEDALKNFNKFYRSLQVKVNFNEQHPREISISNFKSQVLRFKSIAKIQLSNLVKAPHLSKYQLKLNNGLYLFHQGHSQQALKQLTQSQQFFKEEHFKLIYQSKQKPQEIDWDGEQILRKYLSILKYLGQSQNVNKLFQLALETYKERKTVLQNLGSTESQSQLLILIGAAYYSMQNYKQALKYYQKSLEAIRKNQQYDDELQVRNWIGSTYLSFGIKIQEESNHELTQECIDQYNTAIEQFQEALQASQKLKKDIEWESIILHKMGKGYFMLRDYEKAIQFYIKSLDMIEEQKGKQYFRTAYFRVNIGQFFQKINNKQLAFDHYKQAVRILSRASKNNQLYVKALNNLGNSYEKRSEYKLAEQVYQKSYTVEPKQITLYAIARCYNKLNFKQKLDIFVQRYQLDLNRIQNES